MQYGTNRNPDANVVALFRNHTQKNEARSAQEGRPIFDDVEVCELRYPGSRNVGVYPATSFSHWADDPQTGEPKKVSYAERFPQQYRQFKSQDVQTKAGTPLDYATFLTEARRAELRALNVYTIEALAAIEGAELKNLGPGGRDMKNRATEYLAESQHNAVNTQMAAELEALKARNLALEEDMKAIKDGNVSEGEFENMTTDQLREYIKTYSGHAPVGSFPRKSLLKMAQNVRRSAERDDA